MMKKKFNNLQLARLKGSAMKLRANYQLPYYLSFLIRNIDVNSSVAYINLLKCDTEHYLRVKGYYKKYPTVEKVCNDELRNKYHGLERK